MATKPSEDSRCHLEKLFPRIAQALTEKWGKPELESYLADLLVDNRGARQGFPAPIMGELILIDAILWELSDHRKDFLPQPHDADFLFGGP